MKRASNKNIKMNKLIPLVMFVSFTMTFSGCISDKAGTSSNPVVLKSPHGRLAAAMVVSPALTKDKVKGPLKLFILAGPFTPTAEKANQGGQWRSEPPADMTTTPLAEVPLDSSTQAWGSLQIDKAVSGSPLAIAGRPFAHGLGTHAASEIVYDVNNSADSFTAWVGVDYVVIPLFPLLEPSSDTGLSLVLSPDDAMLAMAWIGSRLPFSIPARTPPPPSTAGTTKDSSNSPFPSSMVARWFS